MNLSENHGFVLSESTLNLNIRFLTVQSLLPSLINKHLRAKNSHGIHQLNEQR